MPRVRAIALLLAISAAPLASSVARADVSPQDKAKAEALFQVAKKMIGDGNAAEACPKLAESNRLDPKVGTLLYLATCHEQAGKTASAWAEYREALARLASAHNPEREKYARDRADALEKKLSRLVISPEQPAEGLEVRVDGESIGAASFGTPLPYDPGEHRIEAAAPKHRAWTEAVTLEAGPVDLPVSVPPLAEEAPAPPPPPPPVEPPKPSPLLSRKTLGYAAAGVGVVGIGVGTVFGIDVLSKKSDADSNDCRGKACNPSGLDLYSSARTSGWISTAGFGVGVLGAGAAGYLLFIARDAPSRDKGFWVAPRIGGLAFGGRW